MFSHVTIGLNDVEASTPFYDAVMGALGHRVFFDEPGYRGYGEPAGSQIWIVLPFDGNPATVGNGSMVAFVAETRHAVDAAHRAAMSHGGTDEGAPGLRPHYHKNYYGAYFRDPAGNKLCVVCHRSP